MTRAFVIGNGVSRKPIDLTQLKTHGTVYGCNALHRDFIPNVLIATDRPIAEQIQRSGYSQEHLMYTRKPIEGLGARRIQEAYWGYSSGPVAASIAAADGHSDIYLLGFDMAGVNDRFNNVYADSEFYKRSASVPTYTGNWERQLLKIMQDYPNINWVRVHGPITAAVESFQKVLRYKRMELQEFISVFNS
jgi:hypothetical protein